MQAMGSLCHEVAKLQADRAQLEDLLAQVLHPFLTPPCARSAGPSTHVCHRLSGLYQVCAAVDSLCMYAGQKDAILLAELQEARELREVYTERDKLQSQVDALHAEVTAWTHVLRFDMP